MMLVLPDAEAEVEALLGRRSLPDSHAASFSVPAVERTSSAVANTSTNKIMGTWHDKMKEETSRAAPRTLHAVLSSLRPLPSSTDPSRPSKTFTAGREQRYQRNINDAETPSRPILPSPVPLSHFHKSLLIKRQEEEDQRRNHPTKPPLVSHSLPNLSLLPPSQPLALPQPRPEVSLPLYGLLSETLEDPGPRQLTLHSSNLSVIRSRPSLPFLPTVNEDASNRGTVERSVDADEEEEEEEGTEALLSYLLVKFTRARQRRLMHRILSYWFWFKDSLRSERRRIVVEDHPVSSYQHHSNPLFSSHLLPPPPPSSPPLYVEMRSLLMQMEQVASGTEIFASPPPPLLLYLQLHL